MQSSLLHAPIGVAQRGQPERVGRQRAWDMEWWRSWALRQTRRQTPGGQGIHPGHEAGDRSHRQVVWKVYGYGATDPTGSIPDLELPYRPSIWSVWQTAHSGPRTPKVHGRGSACRHVPERQWTCTLERTQAKPPTNPLARSRFPATRKPAHPSSGTRHGGKGGGWHWRYAVAHPLAASENEGAVVQPEC